MTFDHLTQVFTDIHTLLGMGSKAHTRLAIVRINLFFSPLGIAPT